MQLKIRRIDKSLPLPNYAKKSDAALDLRSSIDCMIKPNECKTIPSGIALEIPQGYFGSVRDRSGLASKFAIHTLAGVVDSGYRGEIGIVLINLGKEDFKITKGDRIAQIIIQPILQPEIIEVENLEESDRGTGGFGSTGIK
jgi:dUTP pyrophosphatase